MSGIQVTRSSPAAGAAWERRVGLRLEGIVQGVGF